MPEAVEAAPAVTPAARVSQLKFLWSPTQITDEECIYLVSAELLNINIYYTLKDGTMIPFHIRKKMFFERYPGALKACVIIIM